MRIRVICSFSNLYAFLQNYDNFDVLKRFYVFLYVWTVLEYSSIKARGGPTEKIGILTIFLPAAPKNGVKNQNFKNPSVAP